MEEDEERDGCDVQWIEENIEKTTWSDLEMFRNSHLRSGLESGRQEYDFSLGPYIWVYILRSWKTYNFSHINIYKKISACIIAHQMQGPVNPRCPETSVWAVCPDEGCDILGLP